MVVRAHPFKDFRFHGHLHRPFVMILSETYSGNTSAFDFEECREDVEVGMVVVFFKVRNCNTHRCCEIGDYTYRSCENGESVSC